MREHEERAEDPQRRAEDNYDPNTKNRDEGPAAANNGETQHEDAKMDEDPEVQQADDEVLVDGPAGSSDIRLRSPERYRR